jgi:hypothetical protein
MPDHRFLSDYISKSNICLRCKKSLSEIDWILRNDKRCKWLERAWENLNKYYPCLTDEEIIIKSIIE